MHRISADLALVFTILVLVSSSSAQKQKPSAVDRTVKFAQELQAAHSSAENDWRSAQALLFRQDGSRGVVSENADQALALYTRSETTIQDFIARHSQEYNRVPIVFVQIEALEVLNKKGQAVVFLTKNKPEDYLKIGDSEIVQAGRLRATIAAEYNSNSFPELHEACQQIDGMLKRELLSVLDARALYYTALGNWPLAAQALEEAIKIDPDPKRKSKLVKLRDLQTEEPE